jgi:hypothetical protein
MSDRNSLSRRLPPLAPIALGVALLWGCNAGAATITVANCDDHGSGSLRAAVNAANPGDTVDLSQRNCTITLSTGEIMVPQTDLVISGPGADLLTIDGGFSSTPAQYNRIFHHTGSGALTIVGMTLTDAKYKSNLFANGGCIYSEFGSVQVSDSTITDCYVDTSGATSVTEGGGIYAFNGVTLLRSIVTANVANGPAGNNWGGGVHSRGQTAVKYSTISGNTAVGNHSFAAGIDIFDGDTYILGSTISGNGAHTCAGLVVYGSTAHSVQIFNSTISGNTGYYKGGACAQVPLTVANSTIAFNTAAYGAGGLWTYGSSVDLQSSIIAMNTSGNALYDVDTSGATSVIGANNLITQSFGTVPADTITACPLLGQLADNGGSTRTHRLLANSPALDAGNNTTKGFLYDQRGSGHPRTVGAQTDIGAFEYNGGTSEEIFSSEFENRCN